MNTDHYEHLLAEVYDWMQGGWDQRVEANRAHFEALGVAPTVGGARAVDIGAGTGYQSIPLAELGFVVTAIDPSPSMLAQLSTHVGELTIELSAEPFRAHDPNSAELICCMGDTLTHLESLAAIESLFGSALETLQPNGRLILTYRDGTSQPVGDDRFLAIRSDHDRIFTCFLEQLDPDHTRVHDIVHTREASGFGQQVSSYVKLRLRPAVVDAMLRTAGFVDVVTEVDRGLVTTTAAKR